MQHGEAADMTTTPLQDEPAKPFGQTLPAEDRASTLTSGAGLVAALDGGVILVALAARGDGWQLVGASVFAATLLLLYLSSTLYHAAIRQHRACAVAEDLDPGIAFAGIAHGDHGSVAFRCGRRRAGGRGRGFGRASRVVAIATGQQQGHWNDG
jgi:hypothetical protein